MDNKQCMLLLALASCFLLKLSAADPRIDDQQSRTTNDLQVNSNVRTNKSRCLHDPWVNSNENFTVTSKLYTDKSEGRAYMYQFLV